ncbi:hypothetical protein ACS0TY_007281 [Phlomoides rotata]
MRYPRGELEEFGYILQRWTKSINKSFLLNAMTGGTTRFANDTFEQKRAMIWENKLIGIEITRRKACDMMHVGR